MIDPADPDIPEGAPVWTEADIAPMPELPQEGCCPHCGKLYISGSGGKAQVDDAGVCHHCLGLVIRSSEGWRTPTYDEAEEWDQHPKIKLMRQIFGQPLPGPEET
jgi:hypothetical protein